MSPARKTWSISAEWILPADGTSLRRGIMRISGGLIEAVGPEGRVRPAGDHRELGEVAVIPGLVNAHTHLELTHLRGLLPQRRPMPQWLYALKANWPASHERRVAVEAGAAEALATGTTTVGDVSHNHLAWRTLKQTPLRAVCFAEAMGIGPLAGDGIERLRRSVRGCRATRRVRFGLFPHAPYSTGEDVYRAAVELARRRRWPIATHLAETEGERQLLLRGSGRLFDFLAHMGLLDSSVHVPRCTPIAFAERLGLFDLHCLLVHVNYIDDAEMKLLASSGASVVYCPRSNDFFGRSGHRYAEMLAAGINVAVGTDSLASNSSLDMLAELARIRSEAKLDNQAILKMGTINAAEALGLAEEVGSLQPGKQADWVVLELPPETAAPLEAILTGKARVREVVIAGKTAFRNGED
ncbi:MAG: amidohydrolase family protein [Planctomycetes bacterium]|nr:amidohydrolase family protein [Planctomycetota bacterium]